MPEKISFTKYQQRAPDYHWQQVSRNPFRFNAYVAARYDQVVKLVPRQKNLRLLDIGCGDGVLLSLIGRGQLYGVDTDQDSLDFAAVKVKAKFVKAPAEKLPFSNNYFDGVIATEIIEHLSKPALMLKEIKRVLRLGGLAIITTPVKQPGGLTDPLHRQEFTPRELKLLCQKHFQRVRVKTSHAVWLKKIYSFTLGKIGRYYLDVGRWSINSLVFLTGRNPFLVLPGQPSQQLAVGYK